MTSWGFDLDAAVGSVLEERTEGWIAGLQMASIALQGSLSMRDGQDLNGFIKASQAQTATSWITCLEEVLAHQPSEIAAFSSLHVHFGSPDGSPL